MPAYLPAARLARLHVDMLVTALHVAGWPWRLWLPVVVASMAACFVSQHVALALQHCISVTEALNGLWSRGSAAPSVLLVLLDGTFVKLHLFFECLVKAFHHFRLHCFQVLDLCM